MLYFNAYNSLLPSEPYCVWPAKSPATLLHLPMYTVPTNYHCPSSDSPHFNLRCLLHLIEFHRHITATMCEAVVIPSTVGFSVSRTGWYITHTIHIYSLISIDATLSTLIYTQQPSYPPSDHDIHQTPIIMALHRVTTRWHTSISNYPKEVCPCVLKNTQHIVAASSQSAFTEGLAEVHRWKTNQDKLCIHSYTKIKLYS